MTTALISHEDCTLHDMGVGHPESPARLHAIRHRLQEDGLLSTLQEIKAKPAAREDLLRVHPPGYIDQLNLIQPRNGRVYVDPDTAMNPHSLRAAWLAAGAAAQASEAVLSGTCANAFCLVRPPGHHAEYNTAKGFCFFNNIAVAAAYARAVHGLKKVAILDFDVHQCNGTIDIFEKNPDVLVCSSFQHPLYPNSHFFTNKPNIINTPLSAGDGSNEFRKAVENSWLPALAAHQPEMLFISAGFDAHRDDPLADINLTEADYRWVTEILSEVANTYSQGRIVSSLEGGYDLRALADSALAHIQALAQE